MLDNDASTSELQTRIHSVPSHGSADRDMVVAEMWSAAWGFGPQGPGFHCGLCKHTFQGVGIQCDDCSSLFCRPCYREHVRKGCGDAPEEARTAKLRARAVIRDFCDSIDRKNVGTPRTRLPWEDK